MNAPVTQQTQRDERQTKLSLLLGLVIWFVHQNMVYALTSLTCKWGWLPFTVAGIGGMQIIGAIITLIALVLILVVIYLPWRNWRRYQENKPAANPHLLQDTEKDRRPMLAFIAMMLNCFFFLFIIASFVPIFALNACGQG